MSAMIITPHILSSMVVLVIVSTIGLMSSKGIRTSEDFTLGKRQLNSIQIAGSIIATLVGGASTIGTSQLAFERGINAMWFTIGASLACLFLGLFLAEPLRKAEVETISEFISKTYGLKAGICVSLFTSLAIFIHVIGQILSSIAILSSMFKISEIIAIFITIALIISYIFFGGFLSNSIVGIIKTVLLYVTLLSSGFIVYRSLGGINGINVYFGDGPWLNLFSDGILNGIAQGFTLIVGVSSTQTYLQSMFAGKTGSQSRKGAFLSAFLIPPIGLACTLIGLFIRKNYPYISAGESLPFYALSNMNPIFGGMILAALIISVVGTGAGLILGISTMITKDIYMRFINTKAMDKEQLRILRLIIVIVCFLSLVVVFASLDSLILKWGFLSMALRGSVVFIPLIGAIYFRNKISSKGVVISIIVSPIVTIIFELTKSTDLDPLYVGLLSNIIIISIFSRLESYGRT